MCSSSGISCLRLEDGRASKSRLRGQFDRALIGALSRSSVLLVNSPVLKARMSKFQCLRTLAAELNPRENRLFLANATMPTGHPKCRSRRSPKGAYTRAAHQAARLPASPPTRSPSASTANEPDNRQQYQRTEGGTTTDEGALKVPTIPMRRSPTIPNPVPCAIWPDSHPAMTPTTNMIRRLSPDMYIFGCGHMSGLVARRICPLALMKSQAPPYARRGSSASLLPSDPAFPGCRVHLLRGWSNSAIIVNVLHVVNRGGRIRSR